MSARANRIVKNTAFLYLRMLITMAVTLYTSRVLLDTLGAEDFGLYHVIAGFVILAGFLQASLSGTTQRFLAFEIGKIEKSELRNVFAMSMNIHLSFAVALFIIVGALGTWLIPSFLTYSEGQSTSVMVVFWFSLLSFIINIIVVPSHAMIIAHEQMRVFAWVSVFDALLKLSIVFLIPYLPFDHLINYGMLVFFSTTAIGLFYASYVYLKYEQCRYFLYWDSSLFKRLAAFSGWTMWGNAASVFASQGTNILLNVFFGPVVNAAKSIGSQASGALNQFVTNLQVAINPQIIKSYAGEDQTYTTTLINYGSKYNFFVMLTLALPIFLKAESLLNIWLIEPPEYSVTFVRLLLINATIESISRPLITAAQATGRIKLYQSVVGGTLLLNIPISYLFLASGYKPPIVFIIAIALTIAAGILRIFMLKRIFYFSFLKFLRESLIKDLQVLVLSGAILTALNNCFYDTSGVLELLGFMVVSVSVTLALIWMFGLEKFERMYVSKMITKN